MPGESGRHRALLKPAADFASRRIPVARPVARTWYRVHWSDRDPLEFGLHSYHRFSHPEAPHPVLYLGGTMQTCLWEVFGDDVFQRRRTIALTRWEGRSVSRITVPAVRTCAISATRTRSAMAVDKGSLLSADLEIPQAWRLAIQRHPANFEAIQFTSRFVDQPCLAVFGTTGMNARLKTRLLGDLINLDEAVEWLQAQKMALV
jgi:hypothetical protein